MKDSGAKYFPQVFLCAYGKKCIQSYMVKMIMAKLHRPVGIILLRQQNRNQLIITCHQLGIGIDIDHVNGIRRRHAKGLQGLQHVITKVAITA